MRKFLVLLGIFSVLAFSLSNITASADSIKETSDEVLMGVNSDVSILEFSSNQSSELSRNDFNPIEVGVLIGIGVGAAAAIVINHKVNGKTR